MKYVCLYNCCRQGDGRMLNKYEVYRVEKILMSIGTYMCRINEGYLDIPEIILNKFLIPLSKYREQQIDEILGK